jgi:hypothetical protein
MSAYMRVARRDVRSVRVGDLRWLEAIRARSRQLQAAARAVEPGVLRALDEEAARPGRLRSIASDLLEQALHFLDEVAATSGVVDQRQRRKNQTFETAIRDAVRDRVGPGDLAALARAELCKQRGKLERSSVMDSVLISECASAISQVRVMAEALEKLAADAAQSSEGSRSADGHHLPSHEIRTVRLHS